MGAPAPAIGSAFGGCLSHSLQKQSLEDEAPLPCTHPMISPSNSNILASPKAGDVRRSHGTAVNAETHRGRGLVPGPVGAGWCLNRDWSPAPDARACLSHSITRGPNLAPDSVAKDFLQAWKDVCVETRVPAAPQGVERAARWSRREASGRAGAAGVISEHQGGLPPGWKCAHLAAEKG